MRSTSSPRAVSSSTGILDLSRSRRSTSNPFRPGSMTSSTTSRCSPVKACSSPRVAVGRGLDLKAFGLQIFADQAAQFNVVIDN